MQSVNVKRGARVVLFSSWLKNYGKLKMQVKPSTAMKYFHRLLDFIAVIFGNT